MKKTPARILAAAIALLLAISLSACGDSFESAMARALSEMQDVESLHMDMVMGIDMSLSAEGQTIDLPISMDMSMDTINEPLTAHATMNMNVMQQAGGRGVLPRAERRELPDVRQYGRWLGEHVHGRDRARPVFRRGRRGVLSPVRLRL